MNLFGSRALRGICAGNTRQEIRDAGVALTRRTAKIALGQAAAYTLNMWAKLRRCFDYAEVKLYHLAENSMGPEAFGRQNWLHVGSAQAGPNSTSPRCR